MDNEHTFEDVFKKSGASENKVATTMTVGEFLDEVKKLYAKYFPKSTCIAEIWKCLGTNILIKGRLSASKDEVSNKILENDMFSLGAMIQELPEDLTTESPFPSSVVLEAHGHSFTVKSDNQYMAYGHITVPFRKTTGDAKKILTYLDKFFNTFHSMVVDARKKDLLDPSYTKLMNMDEKL